MMMPPPSPRMEPTIPAPMAMTNISSVVMSWMVFSFTEGCLVSVRLVVGSNSELF